MKKLFFNINILVIYMVLIAAVNPLFAKQPRILLLNSNYDIGKYKTVQEEFKKSVSNPVKEVNFGNIGKQSDLAGELKSYNPDVVYCIGAKACSFANKNFAQNTHLVFSSIINWQRMSMPAKVYGVSNELNARMPIFMFRSIFPKVNKIGILYSKKYTLQWFNNTSTQADELGINIVGRPISDKQQTIDKLYTIIGSIDALWLIPDPLVISEKKNLYKLLDVCDKKRIPVFSYHSAFVNLGAVLSVSVDNPTIGRQAAGIVTELISGEEPSEKVQFPAGSNISLNLKKVKLYHLDYNRDALGLVNNIIK